LIWAYSELTTDPPRYIVPVLASVIICFAFALTELALVIGTLSLEGKRRKALWTASLLNGAAVAGPLFYYPGWLLSGYSWQDYWEVVNEIEIGWFAALGFGLAAWLLTLYAFHEVSRAPEERGTPRYERFDKGSRSLSTDLIILLATAGAVLTVIGYVQTWGSGTNYVLHSFVSWSKSGIEASPSFLLVPIASVASVVVSIYCKFVVNRRIAVLFLATESALVAALATTVLWGFAISEHVGWSHDPYGSWGMTTTLHVGWYLSLAGQLVTLVSLVLVSHSREHLPRGTSSR